MRDKARRKRDALALIAVSCFLFLVTFAQQNGHTISKAERQHILDGQFRMISTTEGIPTNIKQAFSEVTGQASFALANPGQKYQTGDVVTDRRLSFRRLVLAGVRDDKWFIHYERGGRGHGYYIVVFRLHPNGDARFAWGGSGANAATNLEQHRKMVAAGQFSDAEIHNW